MEAQGLCEICLCGCLDHLHSRQLLLCLPFAQEGKCIPQACSQGATQGLLHMRLTPEEGQTVALLRAASPADLLPLAVEGLAGYPER